MQLGLAIVFSCLWAGCDRRDEMTGPQIIYAGWGISNRLEVGMNLKRIGQNNGNVKVTRDWPEDMRFWEKPFRKPLSFYAQIPSRGASVWGFNESQTFGEIRFNLSDLPLTLLRIGTNEIVLSQTQSVTFDEIVRKLGQPKYNLDTSSRASLPALINAGQSSVYSNQTHKLLHYPADGIFFHFRSSMEGFSIVRRYADTNAVARAN
jgi:hypothetical protein